MVGCEKIFVGLVVIVFVFFMSFNIYILNHAVDVTDKRTREISSSYLKIRNNLFAG
jgi:hypothetical protein